MGGEKVWLSRCGGYAPEELLRQVEEAFTALGVWEEIRPGMKVVLKPNLVMSSKPEAAIATHPALVAAVGKCVQKAGGEVLIAESPGGPYTPAAMKAIFRGCGYTDMAKDCGFALYTECKSREVTLPRAQRCRQLSVAEPFLTRDYLIDLCKLKTHGMVGFSGAVKNLFGAVPGLQKPELHCRFPEKQPFSEMLVDLCDFLQPDLCIMDGHPGHGGQRPHRRPAPEDGGAGGQQKPLRPGRVRGRPHWDEAGERSHAEGGQPPWPGAPLPGGVPAGKGAGGPPGPAGLCQGEGLQHGLYRPAAQLFAAGGQKDSHPHPENPQKGVRGLRQVCRKLPPAHHSNPGGEGCYRL